MYFSSARPYLIQITWFSFITTLQNGNISNMVTN